MKLAIRSAAATRQQQPLRAAADAEPQTRRHRPDYLLLIFAVALLAIGVTVIYAIGPALTVNQHVSSNYYVTRQLIAIALGIVIFGITAKVPLSYWRRAWPLFVGLAAVATLVALLMGERRWIQLGGLSFQSVELLKFALVIWLADFLAVRIKNRTIDNTNKTLQPLIIVLAAIGLVVAGLQGDLGSTGVIVAMMGVMAFVAGLPLKRVLLIGLAILLLLVLAISTTPYRRERLLSYLHPGSNCLVSGYQECQALIAVGSGGTIGLGLGRSVQAYGYLPEAQDDAIFAIYAEKFGFVGVAILIALFVAFFARLKRIVERAPDNFSRFAALGILVWLSTQTIINIGAMLGLLPLKGITLPLISYGGSSVLFVLAAVGLAFQISHYTSYSVPESDTAAKWSSASQKRRGVGA